MADDPLEGKDPRNGHFAPGNKLWQRAPLNGRSPKFDGPYALWEACAEYFEWVDKNPMQEGKLVSFQGVSTVEQLPKMRAMTLRALCLFLGIRRATWNEWRSRRDDLAEVIERVEDVIFTQKFEGAAADMLNSNLIARELGLADKQDHTTNGKDMTPAAHPIDKALAEALAKKLTE